MFQPTGFHALFGIPTSPLAETGTEGHGVLGRPIARVHERLGHLRDFRKRCELLDRYFLWRLSGMGAMDPVYRALDLLTKPGAATRVEEVARQAGVNRRYLERKALDYSGVSPKALTRIARFSQALALRTETTRSWTQIAQGGRISRSDAHDPRLS